MKTDINKNKGQIKGFTLIELFVVVGAVALLSTIFLSAFDRDKEIEHKIVCKKNIRQITLGVLMYADDNRNIMPLPPRNNTDGRMPPMQQVYAPGGPGGSISPSSPKPDADYLRNLYNWAIHAECGSVFNYVTGQKRWENGLNNMIKTVYPVYRCPSAGVKGAVLRVNYSMNKWFHPGESSRGSTMPAVGMNINAIQNPKQKVLLVEEPPQSMREAGFSPITNGTFCLGVSAGASLNHLGIGHITFCDGHIEEIKTEQLLQMIGDDAKRTLYFDPTK